MSTSSDWTQAWSKSTLCKGNGVIVEGAVVSTRIHSVFLRNAADKAAQEDQLPTRFLAVVVHVDLACKRNFDAHGVELAPKTTRTKAVGKGYLNQFERIDATLVEKVSNSELLAMFGGGGGNALPAGFHDPSVAKLHPKVEGNFEFWADMEKVQHMWKDLKAGDAVRVRTLGNSIFVDSIAKQGELGVPHFTGDPKLGAAWTDKIMTAGDKGETKEEEEDNGDWD